MLVRFRSDGFNHLNSLFFRMTCSQSLLLLLKNVIMVLLLFFSDDDMPRSFPPLFQHQYAETYYRLLALVLCLRLTKATPPPNKSMSPVLGVFPALPLNWWHLLRKNISHISNNLKTTPAFGSSRLNV